jgi:hypothetical protein
MLSGLPEPQRGHPNIFFMDSGRAPDAISMSDLGGSNSSNTVSLTLPLTPPVPPSMSRPPHPSSRGPVGHHHHAVVAASRARRIIPGPGSGPGAVAGVGAGVITSAGDDSDYDSEEDSGALDDDEQAFRILEQFGAAGGHTFRVGMSDDGTESRVIRAHQLIRGQISNKRVASKTALASLQSVDIGTLPDSERSESISYPHPPCPSAPLLPHA